MIASRLISHWLFELKPFITDFCKVSLEKGMGPKSFLVTFQSLQKFYESLYDGAFFAKIVNGFQQLFSHKKLYHRRLRNIFGCVLVQCKNFWTSSFLNEMEIRTKESWEIAHILLIRSEKRKIWDGRKDLFCLFYAILLL